MKIDKSVIKDLPVGRKMKINSRPECDGYKNQEGWKQYAKLERTAVKGLRRLGHSDFKSAAVEGQR